MRLIFLISSLLLCLGNTLVFASNSSLPSSEDELTTLKFGISLGFKDALLLTNYYQLITESLSQLGYDLELIEMPDRRSLIETSQGILDADITRVPALAKGVPNLIQVEKPFITACFAGYQINGRDKPAIDINPNWIDEASPIAITKSLLYMTQYVKERWPKLQLITVETNGQAIKMLIGGRVKTVLLSSDSIASIAASIANPRLGKIRFTQVTPLLYSFDTFVYFNQQHQELAV
jgi:hypothetical protein